MKLSSVDIIQSVAEQIKFDVSSHIGAVFRVCTQWGCTCYFKVNSTEQVVPITDNISFVNNTFTVKTAQDEVIVENPNKQSLYIVLEVYEDNDMQVHEARYLDIYDLQTVRFVGTDSQVRELQVSNASVVGNTVSFACGVNDGAYDVYTVNAGGAQYDVNAVMNVANGSARIQRFIQVYY